MSIQLVRILDELPEGLAALRRQADVEGHRNLGRLQDEWASGAQRFARGGEALLAAFLDGELAGVGGLTVEPAESTEPAMRLRRLYVAREMRRRGVARALSSALIQQAFETVSLATVHAGGSDAAAFWEAMDFRPVGGCAWSHELRR